jgi:hypothetical protein
MTIGYRLGVVAFRSPIVGSSRTFDLTTTKQLLRASNQAIAERAAPNE